jgi:hypothetical protein
MVGIIDLAKDELPTHTIKMNAWELGLLIQIIWKSDYKDQLMGVFNQIIEAHQVIKDQNGVTVEKLPGGMVKIVDKDKNVIIRQLYEWEK